MTVRITGRIEKPDWFDLKKYEDSKQLNTSGWFVQIFIRILAYKATRGVGSILEELQQCGIYPLEKFLGNKERFACTVSNVLDLTKGDAAKISMNLPEELTDFGAEYNFPNVRDNNMFKRVLKERGVEELAQETYSDDDLRKYVVVDLLGSDEKILSDFKYWLRNERERTRAGLYKKKITMKTFHSWAEARVLPCIDLLEWAKMNDMKIPDHVMGSWVYPDKEDIVDTTEKFRKTRKTANNIMEPGFCAALMNRADI